MPFDGIADPVATKSLQALELMEDRIGAAGVGGPKRVTRSRIDGTNGRSSFAGPL